MRDQMPSGRQDLRRRAVILLQPDYHGAREILLEFEDVADLGAAPTIDRLIIVADAADVLVLLGEQAQPKILRDICVLVLIDQQIAEFALPFRQNRRLFQEDGQIMQQQIAEIGGVQHAQPLLIEPVQLRQPATSKIAGLAWIDLIGGEAAILPALDGAQHRARRPALVVDILGLQQLLDQADLVVGVEDGEVGFEPDRLGMAPEDARGERMESAEPHALDGRTDQPLQPLAHLACRLVGEGHGQDLAGEGLAQGQDMGEARDQRPRLAGAGPGQHQDRPVQGFDRQALRFVEIGEIGGRQAGHRHARHLKADPGTGELPDRRGGLHCCSEPRPATRAQLMTETALRFWAQAAASCPMAAGRSLP